MRVHLARQDSFDLAILWLATTRGHDGLLRASHPWSSIKSDLDISLLDLPQFPSGLTRKLFGGMEMGWGCGAMFGNLWSGSRRVRKLA